MNTLRTMSLMLVLLIIAPVGGMAADQPAPVQQAVKMLAARLNVAPETIQVISVTGVEWPDTSLGHPEPGKLYAQMITSGYRVVLAADGRRYQVHTDMRNRAVLHAIDGVVVTQAEPPAGDAAGGVGPAPAMAQCQADLARRLGIAASEVKVARVEAVAFPDASLGLPRPGEVYAQVITPGSIVDLVAKDTHYIYAAARGACRYGGPLDARMISALYLEPIPNEANLNSNLVQVSVAGTNPRVLIPGVTDYRPQLDGSILASRRTSRSGFDLVYLAPGGDKPVTLASAFYFGDAAVNQDGRRWIAFSRPMVGGGWQVSRGTVPRPEGASLDLPAALPGRGSGISLPNGASPVRMYWHLENPVALLKMGEKVVPHELLGDGQWREFQGFYPPPTEELMLNKSETLVARTEQQDGQPVTRIVRRWFTGDERPVTIIRDFTLVEMARAGRFLVLSGQRGEQTLGFTVDMGTGEGLETVAQSAGPVRLHLQGPQGWIWSQVAQW